MTKAASCKYAPEVRERAVRMVFEHEEKGIDAYLKPTMEAARYQQAYTLLAAGDLIRAGALMSLRQYDKAVAALDDAEYWDPTSALVPALCAERADPVCVQKYKAKARANLDGFETFPELASLYYKSSWKKGEALRPNDLRQELSRPATAAAPSNVSNSAGTTPAK